MTLVRKLTLVPSVLGLAFLGLLAAGAMNTADALTLPTVTTVSVPVPVPVPTVPPPPTVTVPPVTTALPPPPTVPPVTTVLPATPPPPTATTVVPPPAPPVPTTTTQLPLRAPTPTVGTVTTEVPVPRPARITSLPAATTSVPVPTPAPQSSAGSTAASAGRATGISETPSSSAAESVVFASPGESGSPSSSSDLPSASAVQADATRRSSVTRLRVERPGLVRGAEGARGAVAVVFRLARGGTVVVTVTQVAPVCRLVGTFNVRGRPGLNRIRWTGRIGARVLPPGTYRLAPRLVSSGPPAAELLPAALRGIPIVILPPRTPPRLLGDRSTLDELRSRNVCRLEAARDQASELAGAVFGASFGSLVPQPEAVSGGGRRAVEPGSDANRGSASEAGNVLGAIAQPFSAESVRDWRIAAAILLLIVVPPLVLLTAAAMPAAALSHGGQGALARRRDDLPFLALAWVMCVALGYGLAVLISFLA